MHTKLVCILPSLFQRCKFYLILKHTSIFLLIVTLSFLAVNLCDVSRLSLLGLIPHSSHPTVGPNFLVPGPEGDSDGDTPVGEAEVSLRKSILS